MKGLEATVTEQGAPRCGSRKIGVQIVPIAVLRDWSISSTSARAGGMGRGSRIAHLTHKCKRKRVRPTWIWGVKAQRGIVSLKSSNPGENSGPEKLSNSTRQIVKTKPNRSL